jgi:NAD(P)-dependent dehydrogenase (short-subunit alcohol dehydrogenase family)
MHDFLQSFSSDLFADKTVLVTGGSSGIGLEIARGFAHLGARVIAVGSSTQKIHALATQGTPPGLSFKRLDVADPAAIVDFVHTLDSLDILINAAGIARPGDEYLDEVFQNVLDINLTSAMRLSMTALPLLEKSRGSIINIASMLSFMADADVPAYCASKSGVVGLTRALAHRFGPKGIRVNAIAPGYHRTDMTRPLWEDPTAAEKIEQRTALKRWGEAGDLVGAALFLSGPAAAYITGVTLPVDGGYVSGS